MSEQPKTPDPALSKHRLEALSDGVFAVVLTLLVLELKPDLPLHSNNEAVAHALHELALPLAAYAFAFAVIGIFWSLHHRKFSLLRHTDNSHTALTLAFLFAVTLLPLSISIYLRATPTGLAQTLYFGNFGLIALTLLASWLYAQRAGLADLATAPRLAAGLTRRMVAMSTLGVTACAAAWFGQMWVILLAMPAILWLRFRSQPNP